MTPAIALALLLVADPSVELAALGKLYQAYDLPLPPKGAKLYRFTEERDDASDWVRVGIAVEYHKNDKPSKAWFQFVVDEISPDTSTRMEELKPVPAVWEGVKFPRPGIVFAAQCELLGWHELAGAVVRSWRGEGGFASTKAQLTREAWVYWTDQFRHHQADRAKVTRRLQGLMRDNSKLFGKDQEEFLRCLKLSLAQGDAKPGSPEAAVDELIEVTPYGNQELIDAVVRLGFDAVPALLAHFDDDRLTRSVAFDVQLNPTSEPLLVSHLVRRILHGFMASEYGGHSSELTKEQVEEWWAKAQKEGEESYCLRQVVKERRGLDTPHTNPLRVIETKYPDRLPDVFATLMKTESEWLSLAPFVEALGRTKLPAATKRKVLLDALASKNWEWKGIALAGLQAVDADEFHKRLIALLGVLPAEEDKVRRENLLDGTYTAFARAVCSTEDAKVWEAVGKYFDRASREVRVAWISYFTWDADGGVPHTRRIEFLIRLIENGSAGTKNVTDAEAREWQHHTARMYGELRGVRPAPKEGWKDDDWRKYREAVVKRLKESARRGS